jgi:hypothetical protein
VPSARTRARAAGVAVAIEATEQHDLERPDKQLEVIAPRKLAYVLTFPPREVVLERIEGGKRTRETVMEVVERSIEIATEVTVGQMLRRDIIDDLEAFFRLIIVEVGRIAPGLDPRIDSRAYVATALMRGKPRMMLREIVAQMARYTDVEPDENGRVKLERPTVEALEVGMASADLSAIGMKFFMDELEKRAEKKAPAED